MSKKISKLILTCFLAVILSVGAIPLFNMSSQTAMAENVNISMPSKVGGDEVRSGKFIVYRGKITAQGESFQGGFPFTNMTDGRTDTYWHVKYGQVSNKLNINLGKKLYVYGFSYWSRHDSSSAIFGGKGGEFYTNINGKREKIGQAGTANFDKWNAKEFAFDKLVYTDNIEIIGHVDYCAEIKPAYINTDNYAEIMNIATDRLNKMEVGTEIGQFAPETKAEFQTIIDREVTDNDSKAQKIYDLINEISSLNNKKQVSAQPLHEKIDALEQSTFNGENVGERIGEISLDKYNSLLSRFSAIDKEVKGVNGLLGSKISEYTNQLDQIKKEYYESLIRPTINCFFDNDYQKEGDQIKNISQIVDGNDATSWKFTYDPKGNTFENIVNPNDEKLYFDYDLGYSELIESLTIASFWSAHQSPTIVKVQKKVNDNYVDVETLHFNMTDDSGNTVSQTLKFEEPFVAKDLRVHVDGAKNKDHGALTIIEMNFGIIKAKITQRTLTLSDDLSVNYYANVPVGTPSMKFVKDGVETIVEGIKTEKQNEYKFSYTGINPQCMGDKFTAQILINNQAVGEKDTYSVLDYCKNMLNNANSSENLKTLLKDTLTYGAMAQQYTGYKTDALVNEGIEGSAFVNVEGTDKNVDKSTLDGYSFTEAGLKLNNTISIYFDFTATDLNTTKVKIDGVDADIKDMGNGKYRVYTNGIKATEMNKVITALLVVDGQTVQTATYSVKSYVYSVQNDNSSEKANLVNFVKSIYVYGQSAKNYKGE